MFRPDYPSHLYATKRGPMATNDQATDNRNHTRKRALSRQFVHGLGCLNAFIIHLNASSLPAFRGFLPLEWRPRHGILGMTNRGGQGVLDTKTGPFPPRAVIPIEAQRSEESAPSPALIGPYAFVGFIRILRFQIPL
jgi:hypothetical protein